MKPTPPSGLSNFFFFVEHAPFSQQKRRSGGSVFAIILLKHMSSSNIPQRSHSFTFGDNKTLFGAHSFAPVQPPQPPPKERQVVRRGHGVAQSTGKYKQTQKGSHVFLWEGPGGTCRGLKDSVTLHFYGKISSEEMLSVDEYNIGIGDTIRVAHRANPSVEALLLGFVRHAGHATRLLVAIGDVDEAKEVKEVDTSDFEALCENVADRSDVARDVLRPWTEQYAAKAKKKDQVGLLLSKACVFSRQIVPEGEKKRDTCVNFDTRARKATGDEPNGWRLLDHTFF